MRSMTYTSWLHAILEDQNRISTTIMDRCPAVEPCCVRCLVFIKKREHGGNVHPHRKDQKIIKNASDLAHHGATVEYLLLRCSQNSP